MAAVTNWLHILTIAQYTLQLGALNTYFKLNLKTTLKFNFVTDTYTNNTDKAAAVKVRIVQLKMLVSEILISAKLFCLRS